MSTPLKFLADWDSDSAYTGTGEDVTAWVDGPSGSVWTRGKDQIRQFAPAAAGQAAFVLFNLSKDYSPGNGVSPIAGLVQPGRKVQIQTNGSIGSGFDFVDGSDFDFVDGSDFDSIGTPERVIWTGITDEIQQHPESRNVGFSCLGNLSKLRGKSISTALYQNILTSDFLGYVLDEAGWPALDRNIQTGQTTMLWAWADNQDAFDLVQLIKNTEGPGASVYEDPNGNLVFENRDFRDTDPRCTVSQATFTDTVDIMGLEYDPNFKDTIEAAVLTIDERAAQGQTVIWELGASLTLTAGQVKRFQIRSSDPFMNAVLPSASPNDTVQTLTASATLTAGAFKPKFRDEVAAVAIDWDSTAAEIQTSLESLTAIGAGNVSCNGGPINSMPVSVAFVGVFAGQAINDLIEFVESTLNPVSAPGTIDVTEEHAGDGILSERQALRPSAALTGGGPWTLDIDISPNSGGGSVTGIAYNVSAGTLQTAIRTKTGCGSFTVTGGPLSSGVPFTVNMIYSDNLPMMVVGGTALTVNIPSASIAASISSIGGVPDYVVTAGAISWSFNRTSGASIMLTGTAGAAGATITSLRVRGQLVSVVRSHQVSYPEDVTDIPSGKIFQPNVWNNISLSTATLFVEVFVARQSVPRPTVSFFKITSLFDADNDALYAREISDMITIVEAQTGISEPYHVEQIRQSVSGLALITEFGCEQSPLPTRRPLTWY